MALVLAAAAVLLGASAFGKVTGFYVQRGRMQGVLPAAQGTRDPNRLKQCLGEARKTADLLKQKNLFVQTPPKQHPVKQVEGILGHETLIAGKWYKVGDTIGDAKIVAIAATQVEVEWDGKKTVLSPIASTGGGPAGPPPGAGPRLERGPQPPKTPEARAAKVPAPAPADEDPLAWMGVKLSPKLRAIFLEKWNNASPEEKEKGKAEWNKMSDEQKQGAVQSMEQHM
jgi:hypothetical protein